MNTLHSASTEPVIRNRFARRPVPDWRRECAAVIPCFNEAAFIGEVVASVRKHLPAVIVVDDGSSDLTAQIAQAAGAEVVQHPANMGKGAALRTGWKRASSAGYDWMLALDGDGQHSSADAPKFLRCAEQTGAQLIVGNRMDNASAIPLLRRWANRWMSRRLSSLAGVFLPDSQCGYRLINLNALEQASIASHRFEVESEMLVNFLRAGRRVKFVPIRVIYKLEQSKIQPVRDAWRWLRWRLSQQPLRARSTMRAP